jgi:CheY-like chemotaxis protein
MALSSFEEFETQLQNTLNHFYNPLFHPEEPVLEILGLKPSQGMEAVRQELRTHIGGMKPDATIPTDTPSRRFYEILKHRYLDSVSQEEAAFQLGMTPRNLRRIQQRAVYALAQKIWDAYQKRSEQDKKNLEPASPLPDTDHLPILRELEVLQSSSPGAVADLTESLERIRVISLAAFNHQHIQLEVEKPEIQLTIPIHPSVLDQILLATVEQLGKQTIGGALLIKGSLQGKFVEINIIATRNPPEIPYTTNPAMLEMLNRVGGTQSISQGPQQIEVSFRFPTVSNITILLIDDNPDFFHLFRRYTRMTRYVMHNIREGAQLQNALEEFHPQVIILDVLLPDVDGWQLLIDLQNSPHGKAIPVIVCTALGQKDLAQSLGARAYLPKPVTREEFLETLDAIDRQSILKVRTSAPKNRAH